MKIFLFVLLLFAFCFSASQQISAISEFTGQYYIIKVPATVNKGDTLLVPAGSAVLFAPFASLTVSGFLISEGTKQAPVNFSSALDSNNSASAFDWVGIEILPGGTCSLSYTFIGYSVSGLTVQDSNSVKLKECLFSKNGQWSFNVAGKVVDVPEMQPFTYPKQVSAPVRLPGPAAPKPSYLSQHKKAVSLVAAAACAAAGTALLVSSKNASDEYYAFKPGNEKFDSMNQSDRQARYDQLQKTYSFRKWTGVSFLSFSSVFFGLIFYFH